MSVKEVSEYDPHIGRVFGKVDFGGNQVYYIISVSMSVLFCNLQDLGETDKNANEALVCMLVGLRQYWKIPIAYFLAKGVNGTLLAGLIRECLERSFKVYVMFLLFCNFANIC